MRRWFEIIALFALFCVSVLPIGSLVGAMLYYTWPAPLVLLFIGLAVWQLMREKPQATPTRLPPGTYRIVFDPVSHRRR